MRTTPIRWAMNGGSALRKQWCVAVCNRRGKTIGQYKGKGLENELPSSELGNLLYDIWSRFAATGT